MKKAAFCTILFTLVIVLAGALPAAAAPHYICKDLGTLPIPFTSDSYVYAINAAGQVVGESEDYPSWPGNGHAFLYSGGVMKDLGAFTGTLWSEAYGINAVGQVVGFSNISPYGYEHAFLYSGGVMQDLGTLLSPYNDYNSWACGINDAGQVVGWSDTISVGQYHAFLYSNGVMQDLGTLQAPYNFSSFANAINAAGQVAGCSGTSPAGWPAHAFLYSGGVMHDLGTLPSPYSNNSKALGINAAGQVVGYSGYVGPSVITHAFLYSGGVMYDLNRLVTNLPKGVTFSEARGINDRGQIAANGTNSNTTWSANHAYLLTPIKPAPAPALNLLLQ